MRIKRRAGRPKFILVRNPVGRRHCDAAFVAAQVDAQTMNRAQPYTSTPESRPLRRDFLHWPSMTLSRFDNRADGKKRTYAKRKVLPVRSSCRLCGDDLGPRSPTQYSQ